MHSNRDNRRRRTAQVVFNFPELQATFLSRLPGRFNSPESQPTALYLFPLYLKSFFRCGSLHRNLDRQEVRKQQLVLTFFDEGTQFNSETPGYCSIIQVLPYLLNW